jgi:hypothetical protein
LGLVDASKLCKNLVQRSVRSRGRNRREVHGLPDPSRFIVRSCPDKTCWVYDDGGPKVAKPLWGFAVGLRSPPASETAAASETPCGAAAGAADAAAGAADAALEHPAEDVKSLHAVIQLLSPVVVSGETDISVSAAAAASTDEPDESKCDDDGCSSGDVGGLGIHPAIPFPEVFSDALLQQHRSVRFLGRGVLVCAADTTVLQGVVTELTMLLIGSRRCACVFSAPIDDRVNGGWMGEVGVRRPTDCVAGAGAAGATGVAGGGVHGGSPVCERRERHNGHVGDPQRVVLTEIDYPIGANGRPVAGPGVLVLRSACCQHYVYVPPDQDGRKASSSQSRCPACQSSVLWARSQSNRAMDAAADADEVITVDGATFVIPARLRKKKLAVDSLLKEVRVALDLL